MGRVVEAGSRFGESAAVILGVGTVSIRSLPHTLMNIGRSRIVPRESGSIV